MSTISIEVDAESARAFATASSDERRKLELLLALRLRELTAGSPRPLAVVMNDVGKAAAAQGLTIEGLESLLHGR